MVAMHYLSNIASDKAPNDLSDSIKSAGASGPEAGVLSLFVEVAGAFA